MAQCYHHRYFLACRVAVFHLGAFAPFGCPNHVSENDFGVLSPPRLFHDLAADQHPSAQEALAWEPALAQVQEQALAAEEGHPECLLASPVEGLDAEERANRSEAGRYQQDQKDHRLDRPLPEVERLEYLV